VIGPDGLAGLRFGDDVTSHPELLTWSPARCRADTPDGAYVSGVWIPSDERFLAGEFIPEAYFGLVAPDGRLDAVKLLDTTVSTAEGIRIGSSRDDVVEAYPDAIRYDADTSSVFVIEGSVGQLNIEVVDYEYDPEFDGRVRYLWSTADRTTPPEAVGASDAYGICPV